MVAAADSILARNRQCQTRHVVFLYATFFLAASLYAYKATRGIPSPAREIYQNLITHAGSALLLAIVVLVVPELRRALPALYARPNSHVSNGDIALFVLTMFTWTAGLYMVVLVWPALVWDPGLFPSSASENRSFPSISCSASLPFWWPAFWPH
jgi:hypothetical protein